MYNLKYIDIKVIYIFMHIAYAMRWTSGILVRACVYLNLANIYMLSGPGTYVNRPFSYINSPDEYVKV